MGVEHLFSGSAMRVVDDGGGVVLPAFVMRTIERRGGARTLVVGAHESDLCLVGYDPAYRHVLGARSDRLRRRDSELGLDPTAHHARARRTFGLVEQADYDSLGRLVIPAMMRRIGRIGRLALFVGAGGSFEIWDPRLARDAGDPGLRELADYRLEEFNHSQQMEDGG